MNNITEEVFHNSGINWWDILNHVDPYLMGFLGASFGIALSVIGAAWGIWITGSTIAGASVKAPRIRSKNLISVIFCEATAIYGVIIAIILKKKIEVARSNHGMFPEDFDWNMFQFAGYGVFAAGLSVGLTNVASGVCIGVSGSSCAMSDALDKGMFVKMLIVEIFASALGIFGVIVGIIQSNDAGFPIGNL